MGSPERLRRMATIGITYRFPDGLQFFSTRTLKNSTFPHIAGFNVTGVRLSWYSELGGNASGRWLMNDENNRRSVTPGTSPVGVPVGDAERQAVASLRGYTYQIAVSALAWIDLDEGDELYSKWPKTMRASPATR